MDASTPLSSSSPAAEAAIARAKAEKAAAVYQGSGLALYDSLVLGLNTRFTWQCPNARIIEQYNAHVTTNHLDIGVGTGYFLNHCRFPAGTMRLGLMDLSPHSLRMAASRLARFHPETYLVNVLEPFEVKAPFDSVAMNYLVHCLPGTMDQKQVAFGHVRDVLKPGGVLFGATVLQGGVSHNWLGRKMLVNLNGKGIFSNKQDTVDSLKRGLAAYFSEHSVKIVGGVGIFWARR